MDPFSGYLGTRRHQRSHHRKQRCAPVDGFEVHERAAPDNVVDTPGLTLPNRLLRDAALAEGTVKPDTTDTTVEALANQLDGDLGMRGNDEPVNGAWDGCEVGETPHALQLWSGGIDGKSLVTGIAELAEDGVGCCLAASGHAGNGDALAAKEISPLLGNCSRTEAPVFNSRPTDTVARDGNKTCTLHQTLVANAVLLPRLFCGGQRPRMYQPQTGMDLGCKALSREVSQTHRDTSDSD